MGDEYLSKKMGLFLTDEEIKTVEKAVELLADRAIGKKDIENVDEKTKELLKEVMPLSGSQLDQLLLILYMSVSGGIAVAERNFHPRWCTDCKDNCTSSCAISCTGTCERWYK